MFILKGNQRKDRSAKERQNDSSLLHSNNRDQKTHWNHIFDAKTNHYQSRILVPAKSSVQIDGEKKIFSHKNGESLSFTRSC